MKLHPMHRAGSALAGCAGLALSCLCARAETELWDFRINGTLLYSKPVVREGRLYVAYRPKPRGGTPSRILCLDAATGRRVWTCDHIDDLTTPRFGDGRLFMPAELDGVWCLDERTGRRLWQFKEVKYPARTSLCPGDGRLLVSDAKNWYCLDSATGRRIWRMPSGHVRVRPIISGGRAYLLSTPSLGVWKAHAVDVATGGIVWEADLARGGGRDPKQMGLHEKKLCVFEYGNATYLDASSGRTLWSIENHTFNPPTFARGLILLSGVDLIAVDAATGKKKWTFSVPAPPVRGCGNREWHFSQPVLVGGRAFVTHRDGHLYCIDAATGKELWKRRFLNLTGPPKIDGDTVVVMDNDFRDIHGRKPGGRIVALDRSTGRETWRWERDGAYLRHMTAAAGRFFVVVSDHGVVCIGPKCRSR